MNGKRRSNAVQPSALTRTLVVVRSRSSEQSTAPPPVRAAAASTSCTSRVGSGRIIAIRPRARRASVAGRRRRRLRRGLGALLGVVRRVVRALLEAPTLRRLDVVILVVAIVLDFVRIAAE